MRIIIHNIGEQRTERLSENNIGAKVHRSQITCAHGTGMALYPSFKSLFLLWGENLDFRLLIESVSFVLFSLCQDFFLVLSTELSIFYRCVLGLYGPGKKKKT